jgi:hypothetical protein
MNNLFPIINVLSVFLFFRIKARGYDDYWELSSVIVLFYFSSKIVDNF